MKILVTGGAGFIGSHLTESLIAAGHDVVVLDDLSTGRKANLPRPHERLHFIQGSVGDAALLASLPKIDAAFHLAAQTSVTLSVADPLRDFAANVDPVRTLTEWLRQKKVRRFFYVNTAGALYGEAQTYPTDERALLQPQSPYGATKAFGEMYLAALCRSLKEAGEWSSDPKADNFFTWMSFRLANVYGPRQSGEGEAGVVPLFFGKFVAGETPTIFGDGGKTRDYLHVDDAVRALMLGLERSREACFDEVFNLGTAIETKDLAVFDQMKDILDQRAQDPRWESALSLVSRVKDPRYAPVRAGEIVRSVLNIAKADAFLSWRPNVSFREGLELTIDAYLKALK